jgi:hypothetical protein
MVRRGLLFCVERRNGMIESVEESFLGESRVELDSEF